MSAPDSYGCSALAEEVGALPTYDELSYARFLEDHVIPNKPFLLSPAATAHWGARRDWARPLSSGNPILNSLPEADLRALLSDISARPALCTSSSASGPAQAIVEARKHSAPNFTALQRYGDQVVPVADTRRREFSEFERCERPLKEVLELWERGEGEGLYVKDWHLVAELGGGGVAKEVYTPPDCFLDDWLSPPFTTPSSSTPTPAAGSASTADFRFVYLGPAGTFTPLHRDVYGSYSWSANVVGRKLWWLFPPGREPRDEHGELVFDVREAEGWDGVKILQEEGEVIWVPSGWHHQVLNLDFCISINHNFFSSPTLPRVYAALRASHARCAESIADVLPDIRARLGDTVLPDGRRAWEAEWAEEVDGLLARDAGWGWAGFWWCVRANLEHPPSGPELRPPPVDVVYFVQMVVDEYKTSEEWSLLPDTREIVDDIERLLSAMQDS